jgi:hypothetical protein
MDESEKVHGESERAKQAGRLDASKRLAEMSERCRKDGADCLMEADRLKAEDKRL